MTLVEEKIRNIKLLTMDFDGVFTDNRVFISEDGKETVVCDRSDSLGIKELKEKRPDIKLVVISKETNNVVDARCKKLKIPCKKGIDDKLTILKRIISSEGLDVSEVAYMGNDINDLDCIQYAGIGVAVSDSDPRVLAVADYVTTRKGGRGAIREFIDIVLSNTL